MLCVSLKNASYVDILNANRKGDLIELRLDQFNDFSDLKNARRACRLPVIFKITQLKHIQWAKALKPEWIDYPFEANYSLIESLPQGSKKICSFHDFEKTDHLQETLGQLKQRPADIYKIATFAKSSLDSFKMLLFVKETGVLGICMGELGAMTRILAPVVGTPWTYASLKEGCENAPGQLSIDELLSTYRYRTLSSSTRLYGLIGNPVSQSPGHKMHNFTFSQLNINGVYIKIPLCSKEIQTFLKLASRIGFCGFSVTMPFKEKIIAHIDCKSEEGAVNTLKLSGDRYQGSNTDGKGALRALEKIISVERKKIYLLGAGGAAKAFAIEASKKGAKLTLFNRTLSKAKDLAKRVKGRAYPLCDFAKMANEGYDILVNATSLGMDGNSVPIDEKCLLKNRVVMDMISIPEKTPLLIFSEKKGCRIVKGMDMFIQQAIEQYCIWFSEKLHG